MRPHHDKVRFFCLDGSADEYLDAALARGKMPTFQRMSVAGYRGMARGAMPSFTNVNNASIVTGVPPSIHGIGGNFFYDAVANKEVMMNSAKFLRCETIFPAAARECAWTGRSLRPRKVRVAISLLVIAIAFYLLFVLQYVLFLASAVGVVVGEGAIVVGLRAMHALFGIGMIGFALSLEPQRRWPLQVSLVVLGLWSLLLSAASPFHASFGVWFVLASVVFVWVGVEAARWRKSMT